MPKNMNFLYASRKISAYVLISTSKHLQCTQRACVLFKLQNQRPQLNIWLYEIILSFTPKFVFWKTDLLCLQVYVQ